jgi:hypothetical protein
VGRFTASGSKLIYCVNIQYLVALWFDSQIGSMSIGPSFPTKVTLTVPTGGRRRGELNDVDASSRPRFHCLNRRRVFLVLQPLNDGCQTTTNGFSSFHLCSLRKPRE